MPEFKKPKVLKKTERIYSKDKSVVMEVSQLEYDVDGNLYPKCNLRVWNQDSEGFPMSRPKTINFPIELQEKVAKALLSLK